MEKSFIFHDPTGRRWVRFRSGSQVFGIFLCLVAVVFALSVASHPQLPVLGLPPVEHLPNFKEVPHIIRGERVEKNLPFKFDKNVKYVRSASPVVHQRTAASAKEGQPVVFGFYVNWDEASIVSLRLNLSHLTHLVPEWLTLANGNGDLTDDSNPVVIRIASDAHLPVVALVTNFRNGWQGGDLHSVLTNSAARQNLIDNIYSNLIEHQFAGINIDFEQLPARDREAMVSFMTELRARLAPANLLVTQSVPSDNEVYDLKRLGAIDDYIVPMVYDEHYQSGSPGPVASQEWFEDQLEKLSKLLPPEKTVIGFGNYGYDWIIGARSGSEIGFGQVAAAAESYKAAIAWDPDTQTPVLRYRDKQNWHEVWFLDAVTALNEALSVSGYGFRGMALWRLGSEDPGLWSVLGARGWPDEKFDTVSLFPLAAQKSAIQYGEGEILRVAETPHDGKRNVWKTSDGGFAENYERYPAYFILDTSGSTPSKVVALSFDDGPDPIYTPQVLDILKAKAVSATFFVVGVNVEQWPGLIGRMYAEGHLIGNHTYTHPNIATVSARRTELELNLTQRLIEHATGHSTTLFRPPYNADSEPQTPEEITPLLRAQNMGYVMVGERIDPRDWEPGSTAGKIVDAVLDNKENGNIILLHDAGGDRSQTVAALPRLIDTLRQQGYRFVSIAELMAKTRDQIMPLPSSPDRRWADIEGQALGVKGNIKKLAGMLFLLAIYLTLLRSLVFGALAVLGKFKAPRRRFDPGWQPSVSAIVAAYNEETVIVRTVNSILEDGYPYLEVIVVDDGSQDRTLAVLRTTFGDNAQVRILTQPNRGKAAALNHAIAHSQNEILVALDADTIFRRGTIGCLIRHFSDRKVGAVSGNARVGNRLKWIPRFQSIEYVCGFNLDRRALDLLNAITVVPGAVGAWRKELILRVGGFGDDTLAEDTDITLSIRCLGYKILYEENAVAYTEAPETTRALAKQRFRWAFGTLQAAWKHRGATFDPQYGWLAFVALPSIWVFQVLLAALSPFAEIAMLVALFSGNWRIVLLYYFGFFVLELLTALMAYALEGEKPYDLALLFFQRIYFRQLMHYVLIKSLIYAVKGRVVGWGKLERTATVRT